MIDIENLVMSVILYVVLIINFGGFLLLFFLMHRRAGHRPDFFMNMAVKYGLNYKKDSYSSTGLHTKNILEGEVNGKKILIYDVPRQHPFVDSFTVINIDGKEYKMRSRLEGFGDVEGINCFLSKTKKIAPKNILE